jgi:tripartite-type tricarboxylate transporter receptor subunit TctC
VHVPYKSAAPATAALVSGEVDMYFAGAPEMIQHMSDDKIRLLATSGAKRMSKLSNVPTVGEFHPGFEVSTWEAFMAPRGTPKEIVDVMTKAIIEIANDRDIIERFTNLGIAPDGTSQAQFIDILVRDRAFYAEAIKAAGIAQTSETIRPLGPR